MDPVAVTWMPFEVIGLPLPYKPIWLNGDELQLDGWQTAVIVAEPGNAGVTEPDDAGMVVGVVELNSSATPVSVTPFVSNTVAISGTLLFTGTVTLLLWPGTVRVMEAGGHVAK